MSVMAAPRRKLASFRQAPTTPKETSLMGEAYTRWWLKANDLSISEGSRSCTAIRIKRADGMCYDTLSAAFGLTWPSTPNTMGRNAAVTVYWMSPEEWLLVGKRPGEIIDQLHAACGSNQFHAVDISSGRVTFEIGG